DRPLFDTAIGAIEHNLLEEHRRAFRHVEATALLDELRSLATSDNASERSLTASARRCGLFVQAFAPYFSVLSLCTQSQAEWSGCFFGLLLLTFQAASEHSLFLEKVANIFEAITSILPPYHQIYAACQYRMDSAPGVNDDVQLATLMSFVYEDLVTLLLDIYCIFFRNRSRHLTFWRPIDSRFAQLETRLSKHRKWLVKETETEVQDFAEVEHQRRKYIRFLHRRLADHHETSNSLEEYRLAKRLRRVQVVEGWLSNDPHKEQPCRSVDDFDQLGSCNWFLASEKYRLWKEAGFEPNHANDKGVLQNDWHNRVVFFQAKPGYGKSIIAQAVIDDLRAEAESLDNSERDHISSVAYYCSKNDSKTVHSDIIFRQLAHQVLQTHRHDHGTLDAVCLLLRKTSFSETASANQILDILSLLLRQHPTFLVIDGLERCPDLEHFLSSLATLLRQSDARAVIFSRPAIRIPLVYQVWASDAPHIVTLDSQHNANAVATFLAENFGQMANEGFFGIGIDRDLIVQVARQSNGTFLWASTLVRYLRSPALSPDDRKFVLQNFKPLRSLEALYGHILGTLAHRPAHEKRIIADGFRWLLFSVHKLCTSALRTALASSTNLDEHEDCFPTDLLEALPQLTCGLIEVNEDSVCFAHPSVCEYLQSMASRGSEFSLSDESSVHAHLATRCLSYLAHDVPKRPLGGLSPHIRPMIPTVPVSSSASYRTSKSGDSGYKSLSSSEGDNALPHPAINSHHANASTTSIRTISFDTNLPFLRYASLCWPIHLSRALAPAHDPYVIPTPGPFSSVPYLPALSAFLQSRLAVTAWVEASLRYSLPPTLTRLIGPLSDLEGEIPPATIEGQGLRLVTKELKVLSERLVELKREFATSLRENPSLVWQMAGTVGEDFWPIWDGSMGMVR
ncbi:hypothetical protein EK21DRAFT_53964, partial [Setomelanomma holmii]